MPDDRTFVTELATALGMLGGTDVDEVGQDRDLSSCGFR